MNEYGSLIEPSPVPFRFGAPGWYVAGVLLLLLLATGAFLLYRHYRRNRYRREALQWLQTLESAASQDGSAASLVYATNLLLKRIAMSRYGRERIAPARGPGWISVLNHTMKKELFDEKDERLLAQDIYQAGDVLAPSTATGFVVKAKQWIQQHQRTYAF